ncbi:MAG: nicotinamide mononucleotide transporter family protein [Porticoccaceae bacterium]
MDEPLLQQAWSYVVIAASQVSGWELIAVILALAYLLLALRENRWCWHCAFVSTAIYTALFWRVNLLMESALNIFYLATAVYGGWQWRDGGARAPFRVRRWGWRQHGVALLSILAATGISGYLLASNTSAAWPYVNSLTAWASVVTTYMVAQKVLENWLYWIVIDSVAAGLYIDRGLYLTALLFAVYVVIVVFGFFAWYRQWRGDLAGDVVVDHG